MIHAGMGSDLMSLCGKMLGISGSDQITLSYIDEAITCVACLQIRLKKEKDISSKLKLQLLKLKVILNDTL